MVIAIFLQAFVRNIVVAKSTDIDLLYRQECFTGKYTTRKIHRKLNPGPA